MSTYSKNRANQESLAAYCEKRPTRQEAEQAVRTLLLWIGENPGREGLLDTPARVVRSYAELFSGYNLSAEDILGTVFEDVAGYNDPVLVRDIAFFSYCEHHMIPVIGHAHIAYQPDGRIAGLSKLPRIVEVFARQLQTQEAMTAQIAEALDKYLKPRGVAVLIEAEHLCMAMRGIQKQGTTTITSVFHGMYKNDEKAQEHFIRMVHGRKR